METVLTFDIGGTAIRAGLFDLHARPLGRVYRPSPPADVQADAAEIPAELWWQGLCEAAMALLSEKETDTADIRGICITGMTRTQIFIGPDGSTLRPAMTWQDGRATTQADFLKQMFASSEQGHTAGDGSPVSAYHPLSRILWVKAHEPKVYNNTRWILQPKDFLNYKLTGIAAGDLISSDNLLDTERSQVCEPLFADLGLNPCMIPPCFPPEKVVGKVKEGLPPPFKRLAGVPVMVGSMDGWCSTLGIGANRAGYAYDITGTTEVAGFVGKKATAAPGLVTLPWGDGLFQIGGPTQAGSDCLTWFSEAFLNRKIQPKTDLAGLIKTLENKPRKPHPLIFLPYLSGERTPIWDPRVRGLFFGVDRSHTASDFLLAVMQGGAFAVRHILELASHAASEPIREIRIAGGGANLDFWCQIKSDVTGCEIVRTSHKEAGLFGAAMLALEGLGLFSDRQTMQTECVKEQKRFYPDLSHSPQYSTLYRIYRVLAKDLKGPFHDLAAVRAAVSQNPGEDTETIR